MEHVLNANSTHTCATQHVRCNFNMINDDDKCNLHES